MTGDELVRYMNQLSSSSFDQSFQGNFGVGAKIAAATRNTYGLIYLSWKNGSGSMIHLWRDPSSGEYGLRQLERPDGTYGHWAEIDDIVKPDQIEDHGTVAILLGHTENADTMEAPEGAAAASRWVAKYLNSRFFEFSDGIEIRAREGWTYPIEDKDRNLLRKLIGQRQYLDQHAFLSGQVSLTNAIARWWILKEEGALSQNSGHINSNGHVAALYQNELYENYTSRAGMAMLQQFGIRYGYNRVVIYIEPDESRLEIIANTPRTHLRISGGSFPWAEWAAEFRKSLPREIKLYLEEASSASTSSDHSDTIRDRLKQIQDLFKLSRYRPTASGDVLLDDVRRVKGGVPNVLHQKKQNSSSSPGKNGGRAGGIYSLYLANEGGTPGVESKPDVYPEAIWVSVTDKTREPGYLEDRAASYDQEQNILTINADFRVFTDMVDRWVRKYDSAPGARTRVTDVVREWFEQSLIEAVLGAQSLRNAREWSIENIDQALSDVSLTAVVLPRYNIEMNVRRSLGAKLGSLKDKSDKIAS